MELTLSGRHQNDTVRLRFSREGDRWRHRFVVGEDPAANGTTSDSNSIELLASVEGNSEQAWPPSPPLQDVSLEDLGFGEAIMGVGMAGKSHWSASYTIESNAFKADLACLQKEASNQPNIGSQFQLGPHVKAKQQGDEVRLHLPGSKSPTTAVVALRGLQTEKVSTAILVADGLITIRPSQLSSNLKLPTRWGFMLEFA